MKRIGCLLLSSFFLSGSIAAAGADWKKSAWYGPPGYTADGKLVVLSSKDGKVSILDTATMKPARDTKTFSGGGGFVAPVIDSEGKYVASVVDGSVVVCNARTGKTLWTRKSSGTTWGLVWSHSGSRLALADDAGLHVYEVKSDLVTHFLGPVAKLCLSPVWSPDDLQIAALAKTGVKGSHELVVCNVSDGKIVLSVKNGRPASCASYSGDGRLLAYNSDDRFIYVVNAKTGSPVARFQGPFSCRPRLAFSPQGELLAVSDIDRWLVVFEPGSGKVTGRTEAVDVHDLVWTPKGKEISVTFGTEGGGQTAFAAAGEKPFSDGGTTNPWEEIKVPANLEEAFNELKKELPEAEVAKIKSMKEEDLVSMHHGLGMWMRNHWGLWGKSPLSDYFRSLGIFHPDDMSHIVITSFWRHLHTKPVQLKEQVTFYKDYWAKHASKSKEAGQNQNKNP